MFVVGIHCLRSSFTARQLIDHRRTISFTRMVSSHQSSGGMHSKRDSCQLYVTPERSLVDEMLHIRVTDGNADQPITLLARMDDEGKRFFSYAHYRTDSHGQIDLTKSASQGGFYTGIESMGLFWSMKQEPGQQRGVRIIKRDVTTPLVTSLALYDGHLNDFSDILQNKPMATSTVQRWYMASHVTRTEIREGDLRGTFFISKDGGPYHGIIDMFGGIGGTVEHRAALLASRGFATLALQYIDVEDGFTIQTDLDYYKRAVEWLLRQTRVISDGAGMVGICKGGEMCLLTSLICPQVKAVVSIGASDVVTLLDKTYGDEVFPSIDLIKFVSHATSPVKDAISMGESIRQVAEEESTKASLPIERTNTQLLLVYGEDDYCTGKPAYTRFMARLKTAGKEHLVQTLLYPGAGHLLEPPYSPLYRITFTPYPPSYFLWGGETVGHARAQEDCWPRVQQFLRQQLGRTNSQPTLNQAKL